MAVFHQSVASITRPSTIPHSAFTTMSASLFDWATDLHHSHAACLLFRAFLFWSGSRVVSRTFVYFWAWEGNLLKSGLG